MKTFRVKFLNGHFIDQDNQKRVETYLTKEEKPVTYLNLGADFPYSKLTIVIFQKDLINFPLTPSDHYKGMNVYVTGEIGTYKEKVQIIAKKPDVNSLEPKTKQILTQYRRQLEIYAHLVEERTGYKVSKMHLYYPKEEDASPYITFKSNVDNIQHTISVFDDVVNKIESKNYNMSHIIKSEKQCGDFDMRFHCNQKKYF